MTINKKTKEVIKSYLRAVAAAAIAVAVSMATDLAPQYAILIGAIAAPAIKWADKNSKDFGRTK